MVDRKRNFVCSGWFLLRSSRLFVQHGDKREVSKGGFAPEMGLFPHLSMKLTYNSQKHMFLPTEKLYLHVTG